MVGREGGRRLGRERGHRQKTRDGRISKGNEKPEMGTGERARI